MPKCLVTGGAGFYRSNLVDALVERGDEVIIIDNLSTGKRENLNPSAKFMEADIRDLESIKPYFQGNRLCFPFRRFSARTAIDRRSGHIQRYQPERDSQYIGGCAGCKSEKSGL